MFGRKSSDDYINDANQSIQQGYEQAQSYEEPYTTYGATDFDNARNYLYKSIGGRKNYNDTFLKYLSMSPQQMLNEAIGGYTMSPMATEEEQYALDAENNSEAAAGLGGSSGNDLLDAEIGNTIFNQDESRYENQLMQALGIQSQVLGGYDKQTNQLMKYFQDMLGTEEGASNNMAGNAMKAAQYSANADERGAMNSNMRRNTPIKGFASILGSLGGVYEMSKIAKKV
jgi:hypothetical protein